MADIPLGVGAISAVGKLVGTIVKLAHKIYRKVKDVKANRRQCKTLSDRISRVADYLNSNTFQKKIESHGGPILRTLEKFKDFVNECYEYISLFVDMLWIQQFLFSRSHKEEFEYLNDQLGLYFGELSMGINIKNFINKTQDAYDKQEDLRELILAIEAERQKDNKKQFSLMRHNKESMEDLAHAILERMNRIEEQLGDDNRGRPKNAAAERKGPQKRPHSALPFQHQQVQDLFVNGTWALRYSLDDIWHGPFKQTMIFHSSTQTFEGEGENNVGKYALKGKYSNSTYEINVRQIYKKGTGNPHLNKGHECRYKLTWNKDKGIFQGSHYKPKNGEMVVAGNVEMTLLARS